MCWSCVYIQDNAGKTTILKKFNGEDIHEVRDIDVCVCVCVYLSYLISYVYMTFIVWFLDTDKSHCWF